MTKPDLDFASTITGPLDIKLAAFLMQCGFHDNGERQTEVGHIGPLYLLQAYWIRTERLNDLYNILSQIVERGH